MSKPSQTEAVSQHLTLTFVTTINRGHVTVTSDVALQYSLLHFKRGPSAELTFFFSEQLAVG